MLGRRLRHGFFETARLRRTSLEGGFGGVGVAVGDGGVGLERDVERVTRMSGGEDRLGLATEAVDEVPDAGFDGPESFLREL